MGAETRLSRRWAAVDEGSNIIEGGRSTDAPALRALVREALSDETACASRAIEEIWYQTMPSDSERSAALPSVVGVLLFDLRLHPRSRPYEIVDFLFESVRGDREDAASISDSCTALHAQSLPALAHLLLSSDDEVRLRVLELVDELGMKGVDQEPFVKEARSLDLALVAKEEVAWFSESGFDSGVNYPTSFGRARI